MSKVFTAFFLNPECFVKKLNAKFLSLRVSLVTHTRRTGFSTPHKTAAKTTPHRPRIKLRL